MSQKEVQKRREVSIEEEKDFYLSFLNKKLRNARKKLEQIDELAKKEAKALKPEQVEKINSRPDVVQTMQHYEELKDLYYNAYKIGIEEGKVTPKEVSTEKNGKSDKNVKSEKAVTQPEVSKDEIIKDTLQKVLGLFVFSQSLENPLIKEGLEASERTNFENIQQFCQDVLNFKSTEGDINLKQNQSLEKLISYVKSEDKPAFGESSYKSVQETVEKTLATSTFENIIVAQKEKSNKTETVDKVEIENVSKVEQELPSGAAVLKPDSGDVNISPEKAQYIPKVVRFVDEIEKDMLQSAHSPGKVDVPETKEILKESKEQVERNQHEEEREDDRGNQEQKSFRKKRYNDDYGQPQSKYYNNERRSNRSGNYPKRGYVNYKENRYHEGARNYSKGTYESDEYYQPRGGSTKYQIKRYVEKKPQEA